METNINFLLDLSRHPEFVAGNVHTNFIKDHNSELFVEPKLSDSILVQAAVASALSDEINDITNAINNDDEFNPFVVESCFRVNHKLERNFKFSYDDKGIQQVKRFFFKLYCSLFIF